MADKLRRWFRITARSRRLGLFAMGVWSAYAVSGDAGSGEPWRVALGFLCAAYWLWWSTSAFRLRRKKGEGDPEFVRRVLDEHDMPHATVNCSAVHRTYVIDPETWRRFEDAIRTGAIRTEDES